MAKKSTKKSTTKTVATVKSTAPIVEETIDESTFEDLDEVFENPTSKEEKMEDKNPEVLSPEQVMSLLEGARQEMARMRAQLDELKKANSNGAETGFVDTDVKKFFKDFGVVFHPTNTKPLRCQVLDGVFRIQVDRKVFKVHPKFQVFMRLLSEHLSGLQVAMKEDGVVVLQAKFSKGWLYVGPKFIKFE